MADTQPTATVAGQSIALHVTGYPDVPNRWGSGHIRITGIRLDYGSSVSPDARQVFVTGLWVRDDGHATDQPVDRYYDAHDGDMSDWPDWIADLTRTHDPDRPLTLRELEQLARPNTPPSRPEPPTGAATGLVPRAVRPLDIEHDELMARAEAEHQARTEAEQARKTADRAAVYREVADRLTAKYGVTNRAAAQIRQWAQDEPDGSRLAAEAQQPEAHSCRNCEGIDPDTCLMNPNRPKRYTPGSAVSRPTRYEVNLVPEHADPGGSFAITVEYRGDDRWAVLQNSLCLGTDGHWDRERVSSERGQAWLDAHRFDLTTALRVAEQQAVDIAPAKWHGNAQQPKHVGGNAEDCPACKGTNPPYPFICPGPTAQEA
ncbi:hypothetical protein ACWC09_26455 [Streptomyces sp. NPDC001617]